MKRDEILAMQPGNDLNMQVAQKIMGHVISKDDVLGYMERTLSTKSDKEGCCSILKEGDSIWGPVQPYSEDVSVAELVVNSMMELGYKEATQWKDFGGGKYTGAEAICKMALLALLETEQSDKILKQAFGDKSV
jgi:hypothetical protein